jgi:hypothetical protein
MLTKVMASIQTLAKCTLNPAVSHSTPSRSHIMPAIDPAGRTMTYCKTDHYGWSISRRLTLNSLGTYLDGIHKIRLGRPVPPTTKRYRKRPLIFPFYCILWLMSRCGISDIFNQKQQKCAKRHRFIYYTAYISVTTQRPFTKGTQNSLD